MKLDIDFESLTDDELRAILAKAQETLYRRYNKPFSGIKRKCRPRNDDYNYYGGETNVSNR